MSWEKSGDITSAQASSTPKLLRGLFVATGGVENRLHWVLDVVFHDDLARLRSGHGPANMAIVKHVAMDLLTQAKPITSLKNRRKKAGWNQDYLEKIIRRTA